MLFIPAFFVLFLVYYLLLDSPVIQNDDTLDAFELSLFSLSKNILPLAPKIKTIDPAKNTWDDNRSYAVIIDAGSSGSRIFIYSWKLNPSSSSKSLPRIEKGTDDNSAWMHKEKQGLSSFADAPQDVGTHLSPLIEFASNLIPAHKHKSTLFSLFATAGLRLLPTDTRQSILNEACQYTQKNSQFYIKDCRDQFRVISGTAEGLFGWTATNYLLDSFTDMSGTFGFIDLGGASSQIAFMNKEESTFTHALSLKKMDGSFISMHVFVASFLGTYNLIYI